MDKILKILRELHSDIDFEKENKLIDDQVLDSLDIVTLISELCNEFCIEIPPQELIPENFNSVKAIYEMVERLS